LTVNQRARVLLVDDEKQFVLSLGKILQGRDFAVTTAFDGAEALETMRGGTGFDVVVLDVKMPGMDGIAALKAIKQLSPQTQVIMLTGHATLQSGIAAVREGAFDYLMKPCDIEDLIAKISEAYHVENIKRHPVLWPRNTVEELICYRFERLEPDALLADALEAFKQINGEQTSETLYVLDDQNRGLGYVTRRELIDAARETSPAYSLTWSGLCANPHWLPQKKLREVMRSPLISTVPGALLSDVAHRMIMNKLRVVPVASEGKIIGVVRLQDIFLHLEHETE
jgi:CheY-like chemotaxis protein